VKEIEQRPDVDDRQRTPVDSRDSVLPGKVRVIILSPDPDEDEAGRAWMAGISHEWAEAFRDSREDIYTIDDGEPVHATR
jgi:hypothetical protein